MTRSLDEQLNRIERVQVSLATNQITERIGDRFSRPQPPPTFEIQLGNLPPAVRSVADSLALRDMESAKRYVSQYLSASRGMRSWVKHQGTTTTRLKRLRRWGGNGLGISGKSIEAIRSFRAKKYAIALTIYQSWLITGNHCHQIDGINLDSY
jgi:hypothetical protein